jgi:hypothetical protein
VFWTRKQQNGKFAVTLPRTKPLARTEDLILQEVDDEVLVYDQTFHRAHCLSPEAASVWRACDGETDTAAIGRKLGLESEVVLRALAELEDKELLKEMEETTGGTTRREFSFRVAKLGAAGAAVPMIYSVAVATPMAAATPTPAQCLFYSAKSCDGCSHICGCCCCCQGCSSATVSACKLCFPIGMCTTGFAGDGCSNTLPGTSCSSGPNCSVEDKSDCVQPCPPNPNACAPHPCNCFNLGVPQCS